MSKLAVAVAAVVALGLVATRAQATVLINDDLQGYADQTAFNAVWTPIGTTAPTSNIFTTTAIAGGSTKWASSPLSTANGQYRNRRTFSETGTMSTSLGVMYSFDFYDSNAGAAAYRSHANLHDTTAPSGQMQLISMGLNNNLSNTADGGNFYMARVLGYDGGTGAAAFFKLNQGSAPLRSTGWHNLKVVVSSTTLRFYVDGILSATENVTGLTARSYDNVAIGSGLSNGAASGFDNIQVIADQFAVAATIPVPADDATGVGTVDGGFVDVSLDWNNDTNNLYDLYLWKDGDAVPGTPTAAGLTSSDFLANNLDGSSLYHWKVDTYNEWGDKFTAVQTWDFTTAAVPEPAAAGLLLVGAALTLRRRR